jgi:GNAT superfamily N-acetyltransferase
VDPFYNIHCDILPGPQQTAFEENVRQTGGDWPRGFANLAAQHLGDTPFAVLAVRNDTIVGWLRFYRAGDCNVRAQVTRQPPAGKALVIAAASVSADELRRGTARHMIEEAVRQAGRLGLTQVYAVASPDIRAYAAWCNKFMLKDYTSCGFEAVEQIPADSSALRDMVKGAHGQPVQEAVREDGVTETTAIGYSLVRRECE